MQIDALYTLLRDGGALGLVVLLIIGGMRGWYVWGWHLRETQAECQEWKQIALRGTEIADRSLDVAAKKEQRR